MILRSCALFNGAVQKKAKDEDKIEGWINNIWLESQMLFVWHIWYARTIEHKYPDWNSSKYFNSDPIIDEAQHPGNDVKNPDHNAVCHWLQENTESSVGWKLSDCCLFILFRYDKNQR